MKLFSRFFAFAFAAAGLSVSGQAFAAIECTNDDDCNGGGQVCGGDVCKWASATDHICVPAGTDPKGSDGWCTTTADCKCKDLGATCVGVFCTFTKPEDAPPDGGAGTGGTAGAAGASGSAGESGSAGASGSGGASGTGGASGNGGSGAASGSGGGSGAGAAAGSGGSGAAAGSGGSGAGGGSSDDGGCSVSHAPVNAAGGFALVALCAGLVVARRRRH